MGLPLLQVPINTFLEVEGRANSELGFEMLPQLL
jgi:hypothetical protein